MTDTKTLVQTNPSEYTCIVRERPMLKDPLSFFQYKQDTRFMVTIADSPSIWQTDLILAERLFSEMIVCPFQIDETVQSEAFTCTRDVLKQRMRYPDIKTRPDLEVIAKTWVLPGKLHAGPDASQFVRPGTKSIFEALQPIFTTFQKEEPVLHLVKIELADGVERQMIYKFLDSGFRPSLLMIKWSHDLDDHIATAHCAGHVLNSGYSCIALENGYGLYMFSEQTLYDICSMKTIGMTNPMMTSLLQGMSFSQEQSPPQAQAQAQTIEPTQTT